MECTFQEYESLQKRMTVTRLFARTCINAHRVFDKKDRVFRNQNLYFPYDEIEEYLSKLDEIETIDERRDEFVDFISRQTAALQSENNNALISADPFTFVFKKSFARLNK